MNIVYLYEEIPTYTITTIKELIKKGYKVYVFAKRNKKYEYNLSIKEKNNFFFYDDNKFGFFNKYKIINNLKPKIIINAGWIRFFNLLLVFLFKSENTKTILVVDTKLDGIKKIILSYICKKLKFFTILFDRFWAVGHPQIRFGKALGFKEKEILKFASPANIDFFHKLYKKFKNKKIRKYPRNFLYVARIERIKGIYTLLEAWKKFSKKYKNSKLTIIGSGDANLKLKKLKNLKKLSFLKHKKISKYIGSSGIYILPSIDEPWGVSVQEFCAAGLPLILSDKVGSSSLFLKKNTNGYLFKSNNATSLEKEMDKIYNLSDKKLLKMSVNSYNFSFKITAQKTASNLLSVLE